MALVLADRVQETTATTGTGSITLGGAVSGYQSFAVVGNANTCYYTIVNSSAWEVGIGTYSTTGPTLARTTVLSNSSGNTSPITLVGASSVFLTYPAEKSVNLDADGVLMVGEPISYSDTDIIATFASTVAGYNQMILQNKSSATNASANFNVSNDASTDTTGFAELGINSSTFSNGPAEVGATRREVVVTWIERVRLPCTCNSAVANQVDVVNARGGDGFNRSCRAVLDCQRTSRVVGNQESCARHQSGSVGQDKCLVLCASQTLVVVRCRCQCCCATSRCHC